MPLLQELMVNVVLGIMALAAPIKQQLTQNLPYFSWDETRIKFALKNVIGNALKHQQADSLPIEINNQYHNKVITLQIKDHGSGIAAEHIPHLSDPFYRADPSRQRKTGGLGLYLVRLIIEAHGGELMIESEVGQGTCVTMKFSY